MCRVNIIPLQVPLDYEKTRSVEFAVTARDSGVTVQHSAVIAVTVDVVDTNDEPPRFELSTYRFVTFEEQPYGTEVGTVVAIDNDAAPFNALFYTLHSADDDVVNSFEIRQPDRGKITVRRALDRERRASYNMVVIATESVEPRRSASVNVTVIVADVNDNSPRFLIPSTNDENIYVSTLTPVGRSLKTVLATDADANENGEVHYSLLDGDSEGYFAINDITGVVTLRRSLAGVRVRSWRLAVLARDGGLGEKANSIVCMLHVAVNETAVALASPGGGDRPEHQVRDGVGDTTLVGGLRMQKHHFIIALLGAATLVLVIILVAAIVCLKTRQRRRHQRAAELEKMKSKEKDACSEACIVVGKSKEIVRENKRKDCASGDGSSSDADGGGEFDICMISGGDVNSYTSDMRSVSSISNTSSSRRTGQSQPLRHVLVTAAVKKSAHKVKNFLSYSNGNKNFS
jgi:protocadherin delta 1